MNKLRPNPSVVPRMRILSFSDWSVQRNGSNLLGLAIFLSTATSYIKLPRSVVCKTTQTVSTQSSWAKISSGWPKIPNSNTPNRFTEIPASQCSNGKCNATIDGVITDKRWTFGKPPWVGVVVFHSVATIIVVMTEYICSIYFDHSLLFWLHTSIHDYTLIDCSIVIEFKPPGFHCLCFLRLWI